MGYRIVVLDPDPNCPGGEHRRPDRGRRRTTTSRRRKRLAAECSRHHLRARARRGRPSSMRARRSTAPDPARAVPAQADRGPARRAAVRRGERAAPSRRGARSPSPAEVLAAAARARLSRAGQGASAAATTGAARSGSLDADDGHRCAWTGAIGWPALLGARARHSRRSCRSSSPATSTARAATFPLARNPHDDGILVEIVVPAPSRRTSVARGRGQSRRPAWPRRWASSGR